MQFLRRAWDTGPVTVIGQWHYAESTVLLAWVDGAVVSYGRRCFALQYFWATVRVHGAFGLRCWVVVVVENRGLLNLKLWEYDVAPIQRYQQQLITSDSLSLCARVAFATWYTAGSGMFDDCCTISALHEPNGSNTNSTHFGAHFERLNFLETSSSVLVCPLVSLSSYIG
jgi:hypothetical protein